MLLRGQTYLVHCGSISLPADHRGLLSPKSSIGTDNRFFFLMCNVSVRGPLAATVAFVCRAS